MDNKDNNFIKASGGFPDMWTDDGLMDFVNWYLDFCGIEDHYQLESKVIIEVYKQQKIAGGRVRTHAENICNITLGTPRSYNEDIVLSDNIEKYLRENREAIITDLEFLKS